MRKFSREDIIKIGPKETLKQIRLSLVAASKGDIKVPKRMHLKNQDSTYLIMPAYNNEYYCTKLVQVCPENKTHNLPVIQGDVFLYGAKDGILKAHLDAPSVTAYRTAAVSALGLDLISDEKATSLGIIGMGEQAIYQALFSSEVRNFERIYCYSRNTEKFDEWSSRIHKFKPELKIQLSHSAEELVESSDVIIGATDSDVPIFNPVHIDLSKKSFISIGSFKKSMQELPDEVYASADYVIVDTLEAIDEVGDLINPLNAGILKREQILSLGDLLSGSEMLDPSKNYMFKSVGMAALDLSLSVAVYENSLL